MTDTPTPAEKPKRGRPRGVGNKTTETIRAYIMRHADPTPYLATVIRGRKIKVPDPENPTKTIKRIPTTEERIAAARLLLPRVSPEMRETALTGRDQGPISVTINKGSA